MKAPVCMQCADSGLLCPACNSRMEKGEITQRDVDISRTFYKLERKGIIPDFEFKKSVELGDFVLILAAGNIAPLIGKGGRIVRLVSDEIGTKVRIVGDGDMKQMTQDLVFPARVLGLNILHTEKGAQYKIVLSIKDKNKLVMEEATLQKAVDYIAKQTVCIRYE